jgi:hypothetical protein
LAENLGPTTRSADLAREILTHAEQEVRELLAQGLAPAEQSARSRAIVARAQREVSDILAHGRDDAEVVDVQPSAEPVAFQFASLRAHALPSEEGELCYRLSGRLTLATMLAFQQAVSRLPGVTSARVVAEPDDMAVLRMKTSDLAQVQPLLVSMPGVKLEVDPA